MFFGTFVTNPLWIALYILCGLSSALIARRNHSKVWPWLLAGVVFGPLALLAALMKPKPR